MMIIIMNNIAYYINPSVSIGCSKSLVGAFFFSYLQTFISFNCVIWWYNPRLFQKLREASASIRSSQKLAHSLGQSQLFSWFLPKFRLLYLSPFRRVPLLPSQTEVWGCQIRRIWRVWQSFHPVATQCLIRQPWNVWFCVVTVKPQPVEPCYRPCGWQGIA